MLLGFLGKVLALQIPVTSYTKKLHREFPGNIFLTHHVNELTVGTVKVSAHTRSPLAAWAASPAACSLRDPMGHMEYKAIPFVKGEQTVGS